MESQKFEVTFLRKVQVAKETVAFYFRPTSAYSFIAGQYNRLMLPHENMDDRGDKRYFSIASSPLNPEEFRIVTKIIPQASSFKKALFNLAPNTKLQAFGPMGDFVLKEDDPTPCVFLVGGIGITPELSMVPYADEKKLHIPLTLFVSFSTVEEVIEKEKMDEIAGRNQNIQIIYTVTHPNENWNGETGRVSEEMIKKYVPNTENSKFYIVGPPAMVKAMEELVLSMGIVKEKIIKEDFTGY